MPPVGPDEQLKALRRSRFERDYVLLAVTFAVVMVLTNVIGTKLFMLLPDWLEGGFGAITDHGFVILTTGIITYPLTFLITDVVSEVWGRRRANYMVLLGFLASILMLVVLRIGVAVPRADRFWVDPSGQFAHATVTVDAPEATPSDRLWVDDHAPLGLAGGGVIGLPAADADHDWAVAGPLPVTFLAADGVEHSEQRWDARGPIRLAEPLTEPIAVGRPVVPAVTVGGDRVLKVTDAGTPVPLLGIDPPPAAELLTADGRLLVIRELYSDHAVLAPAWQTRLHLGVDHISIAPGDHLAVAHRMGPAAMQRAYRAIFAAPGILLFASMLAYLVAQFLDVSLFHFWRRLTKGRYLWLRNNGSTWISQLVDTVIVNGIFLTFAFHMAPGAVVSVIVAVYLCKIALALLDTPLIYLGVWVCKKRLGYRWADPVDHDPLGTEDEYPSGVWNGLRRLVAHRHLSADVERRDGS